MLTEDGKEIGRIFQVTEKVAIVTGGGKGIGKAICAAFARVGALVMVVDIDRGEGWVVWFRSCSLLV